MPGWLLQAIIAAAGLVGFAGAAGVGPASELAIFGADQPGTGFGQGAGPLGLFPTPGERRRRIKRRRRRRALTASDKADIGFIVGLLGPKAGSNFATTLAARPR